MVALNFSAIGIQPNKAIEPVPSGTYTVMITGSQEKPTSKGDGGAYLEFEMTIQGGQYSGQKVYDRLNTKNANKQTVDIAYSTLSAICHVTQRLQITSTEQLHGVPFSVVVAKVPRSDTPAGTRPEDVVYTNTVKGYKDVNGNDPGGTGAVANPQSTPQWAGGAAAPVQQNGFVAPQAAQNPQQNGSWQQSQPQAPQPPAWNGGQPQTAPQQQPQQNAPAGQPSWANGTQPAAPQPPWAQPQG